MCQLMRLMGCVIVMNYCAFIYCMNSFSPMEYVWHNYTIHLQIFPHRQCSLALHFCRWHTIFVAVIALGMRNNHHLLCHCPHRLSWCKRLLKASVCWLRLWASWLTMMIDMSATELNPISIVVSMTSWIRSPLSLRKQKNCYKRWMVEHHRTEIPTA
jgi:hypothetical protein